jgi:mannitol/fructose-specific phosphotransferase system IIA component (Ntr-type)
MKSILTALQEGRLIELPEADKDKSLQYLASLIEAVPDFASGFDFAGAVTARERAANTAIGSGWACPHGRVSGEGELCCALGWSLPGIDWRAPDAQPVHIVCMHYIPDSAKNTYLKEISTLARVIQKDQRMRSFGAERELGGVRQRMLDLLTAATEAAIPEAKARMIQLEAKQAAAAQLLAPDLLSAVQIVPLSVVMVPGIRPLVLCQDRDLSAGLETAGDISSQLAAKAPFDQAGYRILIRSVTAYQPDRFLYDCLAIRLPGPQQKK